MISPAFAEDLGIAVRRLYEDAETDALLLLRAASRAVLARPQDAMRIELELRAKLRRIAERVERQGQDAVGEAVLRGAQRGDAQAVRDLL